MIFKKVLLSSKPISFKWLQWYLLSSILRSMNGVFAPPTQVKNIINSTVLYGGRHLAQKCFPMMGYISVFWALASYLWPLSFLILPFLITCPFFSSSLLTSHYWSLNDGEQMIIWTGKVEVTPQLKSHLIKLASRCPSPHTYVFLYLDEFNEIWRSSNEANEAP